MTTITPDPRTLKQLASAYNGSHEAVKDAHRLYSSHKALFDNFYQEIYRTSTPGKEHERGHTLQDKQRFYDKFRLETRRMGVGGDFNNKTLEILFTSCFGTVRVRHNKPKKPPLRRSRTHSISVRLRSSPFQHVKDIQQKLGLLIAKGEEAHAQIEEVETQIKLILSK